MNKDWLWRPSLVVFISNACVMTIELVAGRLVAPFVGVSLYTWTSVIGVILAGMSVGNFAGGKLADRFASRRVLGLLFILAGLGSLSVLVTLALIGDRGVENFPGLPLIVRMVLYITVIFFLPSALLGTISPLVIKLTLQDLSRTGNIVGKIYASSALGSILGTFATGYFLISWFGTRPILLGVGVILLVLGLLLGQWTRTLRWPALASLLLVAAVFVLPLGSIVRGPCLLETNYYCIRVYDRVLDDKSTVRVLTLDRLVHSYTSLDDPRRLVYGYEKSAAEAAQYVAQHDTNLSVFLIGGGGYTFPRYLEAVYPNASIEVAEIDPGVTETAYMQLGLSRSTRVKTYNEDARLYLATLDSSRRYNLVLGDAFNDFSVPYHLTTLEFDNLVRSHMTDDGIYVLNLIDGKSHAFVSAFIRTLKQSFSTVLMVPTATDWQNIERNTFVLLASQRPIDLAQLRQMTGNDTVHDIDNWLVPDDQVNQMLQSVPPLVLTDDYVPVDNLLVPVFDAQVSP